MTEGPLAAYRARVAAGALGNDPAQLYAAQQLQLLANRLADWKAAQKRRVLDLVRARRVEVPRGLYMFGGVGRGKTMLMDLFYEHVGFAGRQRLHFHPFMRRVHALIKDYRRSGEGDPIPRVAAKLLEDGPLLCLDELHVADITDAMILARLFAALFDKGLILVATSNSAPQMLYKDGLNRGLFLPFIDLVLQRMDVLQLEAVRDYRYDQFRRAQHYFTPADDTARAAMDALWNEWAGHVPAHAGGIEVAGRRIAIPHMGGGMARFAFDDLCAQPLGANDYLALAEHFHTFFVDGVPVMSEADANAARRFMTLIDTLYDRRRRLIVSAMGEPDALYREGKGAGEFARTASRLNEMRRADWSQ
jgi:cell division protein ZapE